MDRRPDGAARAEDERLRKTLAGRRALEAMAAAAKRARDRRGDRPAAAPEGIGEWPGAVPEGIDDRPAVAPDAIGEWPGAVPASPAEDRDSPAPARAVPSRTATEAGERRLVARSTEGRAPLIAPGGGPPARPSPPPREAPANPASLAPLPPGRAAVPSAPAPLDPRRPDPFGRPAWLPALSGGRSMRTGLAVAAALLVVAGIAVALALEPSSSPSKHRGGLRPPSTSAPASGGAPGSAPTTTAPGGGPSTTTSGAAGGPRITAVSPTSGGPGTTVVLQGTGLFSADGVVTAYFGRQAAGTSCSSQSSCSVVVPDAGAAPETLPLRVVTSAGTSNGVPFAYR